MFVLQSFDDFMLEFALNQKSWGGLRKCDCGERDVVYGVFRSVRGRVRRSKPPLSHAHGLTQPSALGRSGKGVHITDD